MDMVDFNAMYMEDVRGTAFLRTFKKSFLILHYLEYTYGLRCEHSVQILNHFRFVGSLEYNG